jgi:hypothetical protein
MRVRPSIFFAVVSIMAGGCPSAEEPAPTPEPTMLNAFNDDGPFGLGVRDLARDFGFDCRVHDDEYDLEDRWDGEENHIFVQTSPGGDTDLWRSDFHEMLVWSPPNVHYFFVSGRAAFESDYDGIEARMNGALDRLDDEDAQYGREHWAPRLHIAQEERNEVGGLTEEILELWPDSNAEEGSMGWSWQGFGIDRFQRLREIGLTRIVANPSRPDELWFIAHNPRHYNFEYDREVELRAAPADLTIPLWEGVQVGGGGRDAIVELPADLAMYDTLEIDLTMGCPDGGADRNCWEWDYRAHMRACEAALPAPEPPADCTYEVQDDDGNVITPADVVDCPCNKPRGGTVERTRTCRSVLEKDRVVGTEWTQCSCRCDGEIARWITSYHRHGRWVTDITPSLALIQGGGTQRFRFQTSYNYELSAELRFSKRGRGDRPFAYIPLWGGGGFGGGYNDAHTPIEFEVPPGTVRAEIVAWITGHGFAGDPENCAEFCPHHHHFAVNGGETHTQSYDEADDWLGCIEQIDDGALPNQYGTWYLGRGGWCPGLDVPPFRADVTADLTDGVNLATYQAGLYGSAPNNHGSIWMTSYLIFFRE